MCLAFLLGFAAGPNAAVPDGATPQAPADSLVGQLLIATPDMGDPRFAHAVILMVHHDAHGAFGIVINRPVEKRSLANLLKAIGADATGVKGDVEIYAGGPVEPEIGFIVHSAEYRKPQTVTVNGVVAVTSNPSILRDLGLGKGPKRSLIAFGYAGWGPGQLESELARRDWYTAPSDPKLIFDEPRDHLWDAAMARRTLDL